MRRIARTDKNHKEIADHFRFLGASVQPTHTIGKGFPDMVVGYMGHNYLIEVKDENKCPSKQKLTEHEQRFFDNWQGRVHVVKNLQDVRRLIMGA